MWYQKTRWSNSKKQVFQGERYDSGFEAGVAMELFAKKKAGEIKDWKRQVKIPLVVNGFFIANYFIDFVVTHLDNSTEFLEAKGLAFPTWRIKHKLLEALYGDKPDTKITVIKQANNFTLRKIKKAT